MLRFSIILFGLLMSFAHVFAQGKVIIEGYVYEENDRGFIHGAEVKLFTNQMIFVEETTTDEFGHFIFETTDNRQYVVRANKKLYFQKEQKVNPAEKNDANKVFLKMEMEREPGYIFDVTLAEPRPAPDAPTNSVEGATIEIYNNTTKKMEWVSENHPSPYFKFTFQQGNHYTIMISKEGYITKQIEAYVNVHGCIVCIEGVDNVKPGVVDNLTEGHQKGTLLANIELRPIKIGEKIPIDNLYYDSGQFSVKKRMHKTLDELIVLMENNPSLIVELRSHTDCKGDAKFNQALSLKRANAAVNYILEHSDLDKFRIKAIGKGESSPIKKCKDCSTCSDKILAQNRRTELVITGLLAQKEKERLPLTKKIEQKHMEELLEEVLTGEQIQIPEGGQLPDELKKQIEKDNQSQTENAPTKKIAKEAPKSTPIKASEPTPPTAQDTFESDPFPDQSASVSKPTLEDRSQAIKEKPLPPKSQESKAPAVESKPLTVEQKNKEREREAARLRAEQAFKDQPASVSKPTLEDRSQTMKEKPLPPKLKESKAPVTESKSLTVEQKNKEREREAARLRAEQAFKDKPAVVQDPGISDVKVNYVDFDNESEAKVVRSKVNHRKIVKEVNLRDMDISRKVGILDSAYTGYKIEVKRTRYELPFSDVIFSTYSDIVLYRNVNGDYVYLTGDFATRTVADIGLDYVRKETPKAKLHLFRKGKMVD